MEVDINSIETGDEVYQDVMLGLRDMDKKCGADRLGCWESILDLDLEFEGLGIDIADLDTSLVGEEDVVSVAIRVDADVVFSVGGMGDEGLDEEGLEDAIDRVDLLFAWEGARRLVNWSGHLRYQSRTPFQL